MKSIIKYTVGLILVVFSGIAFVSCEKTFDEKLTIRPVPEKGSVVQIYLATVNATRNHIYIDGVKTTGPFITSGSIFPASGYGIDVAPGQRAFLVRDTLAAATQLPLSFAENMKLNTHQTIFLYDTITSPKQKTVIDNIVIPDGNQARIRFANFVYNPVGIPAIDVYSARLKANIFTNVQVSDVTEFVNVPSGVTDTFYIRNTGTSVNLQSVTGSTWADHRVILTPTVKRSYTLAFRGSYRTTLTTSTVARTFTVFASY